MASLGLPAASVLNPGGDSAAYYQQLRLSQQGANPAAALMSTGATLCMRIHTSHASLGFEL